MLQFNITCKPGFDRNFLPSSKFIVFFNIDSTDVLFKVRQKYRKLESFLIHIQQYSSRDIKLYIDSDYAVLIDRTANHILFSHPLSESVALLEFHLHNVETLFRYDRYPESLSSISQYNHYKSLINQYYGQEKGNH